MSRDRVAAKLRPAARDAAEDLLFDPPSKVARFVMAELDRTRAGAGIAFLVGAHGPSIGLAVSHGPELAGGAGRTTWTAGGRGLALGAEDAGGRVVHRRVRPGRTRSAHGVCAPTEFAWDALTTSTVVIAAVVVIES